MGRKTRERSYPVFFPGLGIVESEEKGWLGHWGHRVGALGSAGGKKNCKRAWASRKLSMSTLGQGRSQKNVFTLAQRLQERKLQSHRAVLSLKQLRADLLVIDLWWYLSRSNSSSCPSQWWTSLHPSWLPESPSGNVSGNGSVVNSDNTSGLNPATHHRGKLS